jgi:cell division septal protein FtsQ
MLPQKRRIENINWKKAGVYLGVLLASFALILFGLYSSIFSITEIEVTGIGKELSYAPVDKVEEQTSELIGQNFFKSSINQYSTKLLKSSGYIKKAIVLKVFPNKISVQIIEREPVIVLNIESDGCVVLDSSAYVLELGDGDCAILAQKYSVPVLSTPSLKQEFKENTESSYLVVQEASKIHKVLARLGYAIEMISLKEQVLTFISYDKQNFLFSLSQDIETQLARLIAVNEEIVQESLTIKELDLRYKRPVLIIK